MAQCINCILEGESGDLLEDSLLNFADIKELLWCVDEKQQKYIWLHTIDEYGDTVFNLLQAKFILSELKDLKNNTDKNTQNLIQPFIEFINKVNNHTYIKFIGD